MDYKRAYALLVGIMSNAIDQIDKPYVLSREIKNTVQMLKDGLTKVEEMYICSEEQK